MRRGPADTGPGERDSGGYASPSSRRAEHLGAVMA
jgi:hypothetical protein